MDQLRLLIASQNDIKRRAAMDGFGMVLQSNISADIYSKPIDSGVSDQPMTLSESAQGAINRLNAINSVPDYDYYVAIEGGCHSIQTPLGQKWYETACAAISDGQGTSIAFGPGFPIPEALISHILAGKNLNEAMRLETNINNAGQNSGFNGWLTDDRLTRRQASAIAVMLALDGLRNNKTA